MTSWISLHDITKLVRVERHFILYKGQQRLVPYMEMDLTLKYKIDTNSSAIACVV